MMTSFLTPFLTSDKNADQNIAESDHQRNFCKKPHVKSSFRSEEDSAWLHRQTDRQTDIEILLIIQGLGLTPVAKIHDYALFRMLLNQISLSSTVCLRLFGWQDDILSREYTSDQSFDHLRHISSIIHKLINYSLWVSASLIQSSIIALYEMPADVSSCPT